MRPQMLLVLLTGFCASTAFAAEPPKAPEAKAEHTTEQARPVVVASASDAQSKDTASQQQSESAALKPRRGRSTSCRCGDQLPND